MSLTTEEILALYDDEMRRDPFTLLGRVERLPGLTRVVPLTMSGSSAWVLYTRLQPAEADAVIARQIAELGQPHALPPPDDLPPGAVLVMQMQVRFEWKVFDHDTPSDLKQRLRDCGFLEEEPETLMALDLAEMPERLRQPPAVDIRRIEAPAAVAGIRAVQEAVWEDPMPGLVEELRQTLHAHPDLLSIFQAYADGEPACQGWIRYHPGRQFADLWGGSTVREQRSRGLYTAVVAARAQEAQRRGVRFLTVDASPMSRPILEKLGFRCLTYTTPFLWMA